MKNFSAQASLKQLVAYWLVVGLPLGWGIWRTVEKLPALFH